MKLSLCALLVALALCCYQADAAMTCPALAGQMSMFVAGSESAFKLYMAQFHAPDAAVEAVMLWKACYDNAVPSAGRARIAKTLTNILAAC
ncbi:secretoglobin family 1D member 2-like isoform X3 [Sorex araneus]|uniref:secretoglobin family 1D member 2-like isoform X3 n=1 Tax=Sorex araneus TaxID=42254 RepID=UPI0024334D6D|nr:secretoglobin family 1D member 2-like isoform X3 [Sorex araneus]